MIASKPENQALHFRAGYTIYKPSLYRTLAEYGDVIEYVLTKPRLIEKMRRNIEARKAARYAKNCQYLEEVLGVK